MSTYKNIVILLLIMTFISIFIPEVRKLMEILGVTLFIIGTIIVFINLEDFLQYIAKKE